MPLVTLTQNFRCGLLVTSLKALSRAILFCMGLDHVFFDFLARAAVGAGTVLIVIMFVGIRIPRRTPAVIRRTIR